MHKICNEVLTKLERDGKIKRAEYEFPQDTPLIKRLKDILEEEVDEKFYLSQERVEKIKFSTYNASNYASRVRSSEGESRTLAARDYKDPTCVQVGVCEAINGNDILKRIYSADGVAPTCNTCGGGNTETKIIDPQGRKNKVNTPKEVAPTLRAQDHGNPPMAIVDDTYANRDARVYKSSAPTLRSERSGLKVVEPFAVASRGRNPDNPSDRTTGAPTEQRLEAHADGISNTLTSVQKDNYVGLPIKNATTKGYLDAYPYDGVYTNTGNKRGTVQAQLSQTLTTFEDKGVVMPGLRVRKLTPKEYYRLQGFSDDEFEKAAKAISNSRLYKTAGNSVTVSVIVALLSQLGVSKKKWNDMTLEERQNAIDKLA